MAIGGTCDGYVAYVMNCYGVWCRVCFGGNENLTMSTKVTDQNERMRKNVSVALLNMNTPDTSNQHAVLANRSNKARMISMLMGELTTEGGSWV